MCLEQKRNDVNVILHRAMLNVGRGPPLPSWFHEQSAWLGVRSTNNSRPLTVLSKECFQASGLIQICPIFAFSCILM